VGFIHDFAAGCWEATVLAICVGVVLLAGMGRTLTFIEDI